jgi:hypothetical protein
MVISSTHGYTESHLVHVIAYDAAGNETESEPVRFSIVHEPKEEEEGETGALWWPDRDLLPAYTSMTTGRIMGRRLVRS